ncbi:MAG TPA: hypothetical protein VLK27_05795 [Chthoniobacterales bacterium]|nr:hypothetical protein [Chthoniobacterales bacterium]
MKTRILAISALTCSLSAFCFAQSVAPYNEGPVSALSMIKTKSGLSDEYFKQITGTVKPVYDEAKKQKIILDYKILDGESSDAHDFNILIMVEYPNMAAFDHLRDKMDPLLTKAMGSEDQRKEMSIKRLDIREILGTKTMREITLK